jgi:hypothetical protein
MIQGLASVACEAGAGLPRLSANRFSPRQVGILVDALARPSQGKRDRLAEGNALLQQPDRVSPERVTRPGGETLRDRAVSFATRSVGYQGGPRFPHRGMGWT